jgi:hypothetical protein
MLGLSPYDSDADINSYKARFGVSNPCAGPDGKAPEAIAKIIDGQIFMGYPTYCVICPDKKLKFDVCRPPSVECFAPIIASCGATSVESQISDDPNNLHLFPNPARDYVVIGGSYPEMLNLKLISLADGAIIKNQTFDTPIVSETLMLNDVPAGLYLLQVTTLQGIIVRKLSLVK